MYKKKVLKECRLLVVAANLIIVLLSETFIQLKGAMLSAELLLKFAEETQTEFLKLKVAKHSG